MIRNLINLDTELLKLTTAGSVDDGKSTLIGRLLYDSKAIFEDQLSAASCVSKKRGLSETDLSLLLDGLSAEREQGITIDVAYRYFSTATRKYIIADTPGHEQYTRNMVTGASNASLALVLCDAEKGLLTQSRRHLFVASLLGIPHVLVVVNKMDAVHYDKAIFEAIKKEFKNYSLKMGIKDLRFMPVSALKGDMIVERGQNMDWFKGPTLFSYLEDLEVSSDLNLIDFRFPVQYVIRHDGGRGYAGMIEGGSVRVGENVVILPSGVKAKVKSILFDEKENDYGFSPQSVVLGLDREVDVTRGDMIVKENNLPMVASRFEANLCWFSEESMKLNRRYFIKHTTKTVTCYVEDLKYQFNIDSLHREAASSLDLNEIGRVTIDTTEPLIFDAYSKNRNTGNFVLIDELTGDTVGAGMIIDKGKKANIVNKKVGVKVKSGFVLWFTGLSGSGKTTIADGVYKYLETLGIDSELLDGDLMRESLSKDLGFSREDRLKNIERAGFLADMLSRHSVVVLATFISPYREQRENLKQIMDGRFIEIFINTPLDICESRDVKGLYKKAKTGEVTDFTGISHPYEEPQNSDIEIKTDELSVDDAVEKIVAYLIDNKFI